MNKSIVVRLVIGLLLLAGGIYLAVLGELAFGFFAIILGVGIAGNAAADWYQRR